MNLFTLSWKNLWDKPSRFFISFILFTLGIGLIGFLLLADYHLQQKRERNLAGIDLVIGAKGSPLQLILSSMYFIDAPTGNISLKQAKPFLHPKNPLIASAAPLSLGDSYKGYRIVGSIPSFLSFYEVELAKGHLFTNDFEVVAGAAVAESLGLEIGDQFQSTHGFSEEEHLVHDHHTNFTIVGIAKPSGTVVDQLLVTTNPTYWAIHDHENNDTETHPHDHDSHEKHHHGSNHTHEKMDHPPDTSHSHTEPTATLEISNGNIESDPVQRLLSAPDQKEITSILLKFKGRNFQSLNLGRNINENTEMQAASPGIEITRLFSLMDTGIQLLQVLAIIILFVSGLSIFLSLYQTLKDRKYELAFMRVKGASPLQLFTLILLEAITIAVLGTLIGIMLSHLGLYALSLSAENNYRLQFSPWVFLSKELWLGLGGLFLGILAALLPAIQAARTDIAETLSNK